MRVLLADADRRLTDAVRRALALRHERWEVEAVNDGATAVSRARRGGFEVLVTALDFPGASGVAVLESACRGAPNAVRVVLTATAEGQAVRRAVPLAHQFLAKPCPTDTLEAVIERTESLRRLLRSERVRDAIGRLRRLPPAPRTYAAVARACEDPACDARGLASIVERDPMIAARVMQLANAPLFARARPVADITEAVAYLGNERLRDIVLSIEIHGKLAREGDRAQLGAVQMHGLAVAALAQRIVPARWQRGIAFTAGLMHDVGKAVFAVNDPRRHAVVEEVARHRRVPYVVAERLVDGVSHAEVGAYLLGLWGLPVAIVHAVADHHTPAATNPNATHLDLAGVIHVADLLVNGDEVDPGFAARTGIADQIPRWRAFVGGFRGETSDG